MSVISADLPLQGKRIACLMGRLPWPVDDGWRMRSFQLSKAWAAMGAEVHLFALTHPDEQRLSRPVPPHFSSVHVIPRSGSYRAVDIALGLVTTTPLPIRNYREDAFGALLNEAASERSFDGVVIEDIAMAQYASIFGQTRVVLDMHNVESHLMRRYALGEANLAKKLYAFATASLLASYERRLSSGFAGVMVCSEDDQVRLRDLGYSGPSIVVPNGIDLERFSCPLEPPSSPGLIFVGSMDYHANISGILHFCRMVLPLVRSTHPTITLRIVGKNPPREVRELASQLVTVTGKVEDVRPHFEASSISIVPLLVGGGTRLKILESMAFGRPVISTSLGAEGLDFSPNDAIRIADGAPAFAEAIRALLDAPIEAAALGARGRNVVFQRYGWQSIAENVRPFIRRTFCEAQTTEAHRMERDIASER